MSHDHAYLQGSLGDGLLKLSPLLGLNQTEHLPAGKKAEGGTGYAMAVAGQDSAEVHRSCRLERAGKAGTDGVRTQKGLRRGEQYNEPNMHILQ